MENKGLIFIPDISGFTRFVNETEVEHSRYIIQELLEALINANQIGLEISEIEGDAILFYKYGDAPELKEIYDQVEKMFCEFHRSLLAYDQRRICQCSACKSTIDLTLKVITHYGEFTGYNVKNFSKLIGKDIIVAHQLLKNDIENHEYWLVTDGLMANRSQENLPEWVNWNSSAKQTDNGQVPFQYTHLGPLKDNIPPEAAPQLEIGKKEKVISITKDYDAEINTLFFTAINFDTRQDWQVGIKKVDEVSHHLPQVGTRHRCVLEKGQFIKYTSSYSYSPEKIEYSETEENKRSGSYLTFEKTGKNKTRLTFDLYLKKNFLTLTVFRLLMKKKMEPAFRQSLENLAVLVKGVRLPVEI
jgi:Protein of unknown function (DUF2652)